MSVIILGGREKERLETFFTLLEPIKKKQAIIVLCPEQYTVETERLLIAGLKLPGLLQIEVLSFKRLLHHIDVKTSGKGKILIDQTGKMMLLRKAIQSCQDELELFKLLVNQGGFLEECASTIRFFKQNKIMPQLLTPYEEMSGYSPLFQIKLKEFNTIYSAYESLIQETFYDEEAYFTEMIQRLESSHLYDEFALCVLGFSSFNQLELDVLKIMIQKVSHCFIELDAYSNHEGYQLMAKTFSQVKEAFQGKPVDIITLPKRIETTLEYFVSHYYRYPTEMYKGQGKHLTIRAALNQEEEIEGVAVDLLKRIKQGGMHYSDFGLLMENVEVYASTVERIFKEYDIPYFLDFKRSVMHHSLSGFVLTLLRISLNGFEAVDLLEHLKSGFYELSPELLGKFEGIAIQEGLSGSDFIALEKDDLFLEPVVAKVFEQSIAKISAFIKCYQNPDLYAADRVVLLLDYFEGLALPDQLAIKIQWLKDQGETRLAYEEAQIYNAIRHILDQLQSLLSEVILDEKAFYDLLRVGINQLELATIPTQRDYVVIGNLERTRIGEIKALYILGANEGVIPPIIKGKDLFLNIEKEKLVADGLKLEGIESDMDHQVIYNLMRVLALAQNSLTLSFTFSDQEGIAQKKSMVIERAKELFPDVEIKRFLPTFVNEKHRLRLKPALRQGMGRIRQRVFDNEMTATDFAFIKYISEETPYKALMTYQQRVLFGDDQLDALGDEWAMKLYSAPLIASPTRLERFVNCPFQHFVRYGLKPQVPRENALEYLEIGNYHHDILDRFSKYLVEEKLSWQRVTFKIIEKWVGDVEDSFLSNRLKRLSEKKKSVAHTLKRLNQVGIRALKTAKRQFDLGRFEQYASELSIGHIEGPQTIPPIELTLIHGQKVLLEGKIDRVDIADVDGQYFTRIIDYKTGQKSFDLNGVYYGTALQLTLYMGALVDASISLIGQVLAPAGIYYSKIDDPYAIVDLGTNYNEASVETQIFQQLKLSGLSLDATPVLEAMDETLFDKGYSDFLPIRLNKETTRELPVYSQSTQVLKKEDFDLVLEACKKRAKAISEEIYKGHIEATPLLDKLILSCDYCDYQSLCEYDKKDPLSKVRKHIQLDQQEILSRMKEEVGDGSVD